MADDSFIHNEQPQYPFWQFGAFFTTVGGMLTIVGGLGIKRFHKVSYEGFYWEPHTSVAIGVIILALGLFTLGLATMKKHRSPFPSPPTDFVGGEGYRV
jgi:hypothetical protein